MPDEATTELTLSAPREDLVRMTTEMRSESDGNTLVGYAAVFNEWAEIDSWEGRFREQLAPGAFKKTLRERGDRVKVLFNHGMDPMIGDKPLGKPDVLQEDSRGLYVEVPLDDTSYNADIKALLRSGALDGMSFRMSVVGEKWANLDGKDGGLPERTITEVRLYEFGPVTFPAYAATEAGVRAHAPAAFEAFRSARHLAPTFATPPVEDEADDPTSEPAPEATRSDDDSPDEAADPGTPSTYTPARRPPLSPERREAQMGRLRAMTARIDTRSA